MEQREKGEEQCMIYAIIPAYNCEKYVETAIVSVLSQENASTQVIVIDDGCSDKTPQICDTIAKKNNRVHVLHKSNDGVSSARNDGIQYVLSKADDNDYMAFLDADDAWMPHFFDQTGWKEIKSGADLIGFQSANCNNELSHCAEAIQMDEGEYHGGAGAIWIHPSHFGAMLYRCGFIKQYGIRFMDQLNYSEDKIFSMQCLYLADRIILENKLFYLYRRNEMSAIRNRKRGIEYYKHIINGYLTVDDQMLKYCDDQRGKFNFGHMLAIHYIMDMIEEHYQQFGKTSEVKKLFSEFPLYQKLYREGLENKDTRNIEYETRRCMFILKNNLRGIRSNIMRAIVRLKPALPLIERVLYPISIVR